MHRYHPHSGHLVSSVATSRLKSLDCQVPRVGSSSRSADPDVVVSVTIFCLKFVDVNLRR